MLKNLLLCGTFRDHGQIDVLYFKIYFHSQKKKFENDDKWRLRTFQFYLKMNTYLLIKRTFEKAHLH